MKSTACICSLSILIVVLLQIPASGITLDAQNSEITDVLQQISTQNDIDLIVGPGVKGKVTLYLGDVDIEEALNAIASAGGWAVLEENGVYRFMNREEYERITGRQFGSTRIRRTFVIQYSSAEQLVQTISTILSPSGVIVSEPDANIISVEDRSDIVDHISRLIRESDVPLETDSIDLRWISASEAQRTIVDLLGPTGKVVPDPTGNRVVIVDRPRRIETIRSILNAVDAPPVRDPVLIPLKHVTPDSIQGLLQQMKQQPVGSSLTPVGDNSILIESSPEGARRARELIQRYDLAPTSLQIETKILQVSISREVATGIDWQFIAEEVDDLVVHGAFPRSSNDTGLDIQVGDIADDEYEVLFSMLETFGNVELISRPTLAATSGKEAELMVGSRIPYSTVDTREDVSGSVNRYQRVIYLQVGLKLWIRPTYHEDDTVTLEIKPEISSVTGYVDAGEVQLPIVETTNAKIEVTVPMERTVVIGGLIRESRKKTSSGVPILRSIPLLGTLFRHDVDQTSTGELVILVTPRFLSTED